MIFPILFLVIAGISEAIMDTLAHHFEESIFSQLNPNYWNPVLSGGNKWLDGDKTKGERFFMSSTLLVGFTEGWHLFKMIRTLSIFIGFTFLIGWGSLFLMIAFKFTFTIFYKYFKK